MRTSVLSALGLAMVLSSSVSATPEPSRAFFWEMQFRSTIPLLEVSATLYDDRGNLLCDNAAADCRAGHGTSNEGDPIYESTFYYDNAEPFNVGTDYEGSSGETIHLQVGNVWTFTNFITAKISAGGSSAIYVYTEPGLDKPSAQQSPSFFKVIAGGVGSSTPDIQFTVSNPGGVVRFDSSRPGAPSFDAVLGSTFVLHYDLDYWQSQSGLTDVYNNLFIARVTQVPTASQRIFTTSSNGQPRIRSGWVPNWNLAGLQVRFPTGKKLTVQGALTVSGATLKPTGMSWSGVRVESGGTATFSNLATIDHAGIVVINGTLTLNNARVLNAPVHGVYASGGASAVTITNLSRILDSASSGVEAENGAQNVVVNGNARIERSGYANIRARGLNAKVVVNDALVVDGTGDALLADSGGEVLLNSSAVARVNGYKKGVRAETFATVDSGTNGGDRLVQNASFSAFTDVFAQDEAEITITKNFWGVGVTSASQLSVYNPGGESVVNIDPVITTDPGASPVREEAPNGTLVQVAGTESTSAPRVALQGEGSESQANEPLSELPPFTSQVGMGTTRGWVESISQLARAGDAAGSVDAMIEAFGAAETELDYQMAWGGAIRFAPRLGSNPALDDATAHARFNAFVSKALGAPETAPWAHRALAVYSFNRDRGAARGHIDALIASRRPVAALTPYPDGRAKLSHAAFGQLLRAQIAVDERDETGALDALAALAVLDPYQADAEATGLAIVFPEADVRGAVTRAQRTADPNQAKIETLFSERTPSLQVAPNPSAGRIRLSVDLAEASDVEVSVYDALGRRVAVAVQGSIGAGSSEIGADLSALPAGVYVARLHVAGAEAAQTIRFTISR